MQVANWASQMSVASEVMEVVSRHSIRSGLLRGCRTWSFMASERLLQKRKLSAAIYAHTTRQVFDFFTQWVKQAMQVADEAYNGKKALRQHVGSCMRRWCEGWMRRRRAEFVMQANSVKGATSRKLDFFWRWRGHANMRQTTQMLCARRAGRSSLQAFASWRNSVSRQLDNRLKLEVATDRLIRHRKSGGISCWRQFCNTVGVRRRRDLVSLSGDPCGPVMEACCAARPRTRCGC